ncbi:hypothetical protein [Maribacter antarcticus]|uniref:hypothetical protein n=1 Tax=Maribacter antarcticus TaxID=505250 RepID=UPI00047C2DC5|nr:hypothetical protein [Maribacter antarcticus]
METSKQDVKNKNEEISVLKDKQNRASSDYCNLTEQGILFVDLKEKIASRKQTELNEFFRMNNQTDIYADGYLVEHKGIRLHSIVLP